MSHSSPLTTAPRSCCQVGSSTRQAILSRVQALASPPEIKPPEIKPPEIRPPERPPDRAPPEVSTDPPAEPTEPSASPSESPSARSSTLAPVSSTLRRGRRVRIADETGQVRVARVYGGTNSKAALMPDGRIVWPNRMVETDQPFVPSTPEEIRDDLLANTYRDFQSKITDHYLLLYQCSPEFAETSARLLESLYLGLINQCLERGLEVHASEFPLVAVIYRNRADFRARSDVDRDVEAYYDIINNFIFFYEAADGDAADPRLAALRRPQTVTHEGTHQILQNIGVQPRLADWPPWLVEGLAELASSSQTHSDRWSGFGKVNPYHMATLQDLRHGLNVSSGMTQPVGYLASRASNQSLVEYIVTRKDLDPTDYALAWSLTHYLNRRQSKDFLAYLRRMSRMTPFEPRSPTDHLVSFREAFGVRHLTKLDNNVQHHVNTLFRDPNYVPVCFLAVIFEQELPTGLIRRGTIVSQSPSIIQEWLVSTATHDGGLYLWRAFPFPTRGSAMSFTREWLESR